MSYTIVHKADEKSRFVANEIKKRIIEQYDSENPEIIITVGGDGTFLKALHRYEKIQDKVTFFIVNTGHLGYFSSFTDKTIDHLVNCINTRNFKTGEYTLLEYKIINDKEVITGTALNEVTIINPTRTLMLDVFMDRELLEHFRGTGICISTPAGSTAYNKSLGGAVVDASLEAFQVTEIAPINSKIYHTISSPLVLSKKHEVEFKAEGKSAIWVTVDSKSLNIENFKSLIVTLSDKKIKCCKNDESFVHRLVKNFI